MTCLHTEELGKDDLGAPGIKRCYKAAVWKNRCAEHGGVMPSVEELMQLIGVLNGWGSSINVATHYGRQREWIAQDESRLTDTWIWGVSTGICGLEDKDRVSAHGATLPQALWNLCKAIPDKHTSHVNWHKTREEKALAELAKFLEK